MLKKSTFFVTSLGYHNDSHLSTNLNSKAPKIKELQDWKINIGVFRVNKLEPYFPQYSRDRFEVLNKIFDFRNN